MKPIFAAYFDQGQVPTIDCVFLNTVKLGNYDSKKLVASLQNFCNSHFTPCWGAACTVSYQKTIRKGNWGMIFIDDADAAGALGYHDLTKDGLPLSKIFVKTTRDNGEEVSVTASHELCLSGDTEIPLLNGTTAKLKDLEGNDPFWVYACKENGELRPGLAHSVRVTRKNASLVKVTLDNGESIKCTPDHKFMLRDGTFLAAELLIEGTSLMPLYRKIEKMEDLRNSNVAKKTKRYPYEQVYIPATGKWVFTHRMVVPYCSSGYVRHHIDFNRFNNSPDNLQVLKWSDHQELHSKHIGEIGKSLKGIKRNISKEVREASAIHGRKQLLKYNGSKKHKEDMQRYYDRPGVRKATGERLRVYASSEENKKRIAKFVKSPELREKASKNLTKYNKSEKHREIARKLGKAMFEKMYCGKLGELKRKEVSKKGIEAFRAKYNEQERMDLWKQNTDKARHTRWHVNRDIINESCELCQQSFNNHKVVSVEHLLEKEDVYDLTVDKYHTFGLAAGVFVHNCEMLIDPGVQMIAQDLRTGTMYAYEVADAVEAEDFLVDGVPMSNFQYPAWFESFRKPGSTKFDHLGTCKKPFQINKGGYMSIFDGSNWNQIFKDKKAEKMFNIKHHGRAFLRSEMPVRARSSKA